MYVVLTDYWTDRAILVNLAVVKEIHSADPAGAQSTLEYLDNSEHVVSESLNDIASALLRNGQMVKPAE